MNNVICVHWGTKYPIKFVNILYSMCKRNISGKFNFYCLTDETIMLEWGSGGSTLEFSSIVDKYYSIEHDKEWYKNISNKLKSYPLNDVTYRYVEQNKENTEKINGKTT